jgi:hypothetical protein
MKRGAIRRVVLFLPLLALAILLLAGTAGAQVTTSSIKGVVADDQGPLPGAMVVAVDTKSGFRREATADTDGGYQIAGLQPGTYEIKVSSQAYKEQSRTVQVLVGQALTVDFRLTLDAVFTENVTVVGQGTQLLVDTRSSAITTNITPQQMENLPMANRNFLSYAALAPGVNATTDTDAAGQVFGSGGSNPKLVNVFIDGLSYKNDIIQGGAFMQDSSRGNPFPQGAVQEYQVLTQNYKAEYEKAASAVITAVTKSGGNDFHGDLFYLYQDKDMVAQDSFAKARGDSKPPYERNQYGVNVGGPIMKDQLHFFVSAERNKRDVVSSVFHGSSWDSAPANVIDKLSVYPTGSYSTPLDEKLYFGKLTWQPTISQTADFSYHRRDEEETRGSGGQRTPDGAVDFKDQTDAAVLRHQFVLGGDMLNEASLTWQKMRWYNGAIDASKPEENYIGLLDIGSQTYNQDLKQEKIGLRDDFTWYTKWLGDHTVKAGFVANWMDYNFIKAAYTIPYYEYRGGNNSENWQFPYLARYGFGDPKLSFGNNQYGVFIQDDWKLASNLTINAGVRWDYETNMLNNHWVTPAAVVSGLKSSCRDYDQPIGGKTHWCITDMFDVDQWTSDGSNRSSYTSAFQPRLGFTWDPKGNGQTVVYGGWGQYYDRIPLNDIFDEQFRHVWGQYTFCFTDNPAYVGTTNNVSGCGSPAVLWNSAYLTASGLQDLAASGTTGGPEVYLLNSETHPPRTTQWTIGLRQQLGQWLGGLSYANTKGYNGMAWSFGTDPEGTPFNDRWGDWISIPGYGFILRNYDYRKTTYDGYFLTLDKPYTGDSKWGLNVAYTYAKGTQQASNDAGVAFAFDFMPWDWPSFPSQFVEKQRFVASGTVGLPAGFMVSSILTLGTGTPFTYTNCLAGWDQCVTYFNGGNQPTESFLGINSFSYRNIDLRVEWSTAIGGGFNVGLIGEAFNVFNFKNGGCNDGWAGAPGDPNPNFLQPTCEFNTRKYQIGAKVSF